MQVKLNMRAILPIGAALMLSILTSIMQGDFRYALNCVVGAALAYLVVRYGRTWVGRTIISGDAPVYWDVAAYGVVAFLIAATATFHFVTGEVCRTERLFFLNALYLPGLLVWMTPLVMHLKDEGRTKASFVLAAGMGVLSLLISSNEGYILCFALLITLAKPSNRKLKVSAFLVGILLCAAYGCYEWFVTVPNYAPHVDIWSGLQNIGPSAMELKSSVEMTLEMQGFYSATIAYHFGKLAFVGLVLVVAVVIDGACHDLFGALGTPQGRRKELCAIFFMGKMILNLINVMLFLAEGLVNNGDITLPFMGYLPSVCADGFLLCWALFERREEKPAQLCALEETVQGKQ